MSTPRRASSVGPRIATPAPSPNRTAVSRPRVVRSSPRECTSAPTSSTRRYWPVRIQASATDSPYTNPEHWLRTSIAGTSVRPSSRARNTPLPGSK